MTAKDKATPRPWRQGSAVTTTLVHDAGDGTYPTPIVDCFISSIWRDTAEANAALIVRAVNAHDHLVALAQAVADHFDSTDAPLGAQARAALALAKGGA